MALSGVSGPFKGGYVVQQVAKNGVIATTDNTANTEFWEWTVPAGSGITIVNVQAYASIAGTPAATVNVRDNTTSVLSGAITLITTSAAVGTLSTATGVKVAGGRSLNAVFSYGGTTTAPSEVSVTLMYYVNDHPNSVRRGSDYRGSGDNEGV